MTPRASFLFLIAALLGPSWVSAAGAQAPRQGCEVIVYWDTDYGGDLWGTKRDQVNVAQFGTWNDQISSIHVVAGIWEFFEHSHYQGAVMKVGPGGYMLDSTWNDTISSFRCIEAAQSTR